MRGSSVPPGDRRHDVAREAPAELFCDLEAVGLGALGVVGAQVDVGESPLIPIRDLRAQPVDVVVIAAHGDDARTVDRGAGDLAGLEVVRDEDRASEAEPRRMRRDAVCEVAGRRAGKDAEAELDGPRRRNGDDAVLIGAGRMIDRIVLDVELADPQAAGETIGADERRETGMEAGQRFVGDRQEFAIAPEVLGARFNQRPRHERSDGGVIVGDFQRPETPIQTQSAVGGNVVPHRWQRRLKCMQLLSIGRQALPRYESRAAAPRDS